MNTKKDFSNYDVGIKWLQGATATEALAGLESYDPNETEAYTPSELIMFEILKRRSKIFILMEQYYIRCKYAKRKIPRLENALMSQIYSLYNQLRTSMSKDKHFVQEYPIVEKLINSHQIDNHIHAYTNYIEAWLYNKGVVKFDTKQVFKVQSVEEYNQFKGL